MWAFYEEMQARLEAMGEEVVPFDDIVNEFMDIVHPERRGHISLMELRRSLLGYNVVSALSNVRKYVAWEGAHGPKAVQPSPRLASPRHSASPSADPSLRHPSLNPLPPPPLPQSSPSVHFTSRAAVVAPPVRWQGSRAKRRRGAPPTCARRATGPSPPHRTSPATGPEGSRGWLPKMAKEEGSRELTWPAA